MLIDYLQTQTFQWYGICTSKIHHANVIFTFPQKEFSIKRAGPLPKHLLFLGDFVNASRSVPGWNQTKGLSQLWNDNGGLVRLIQRRFSKRFSKGLFHTYLRYRNINDVFFRFRDSSSFLFFFCWMFSCWENCSLVSVGRCWLCWLVSIIREEFQTKSRCPVLRGR